MLYDILETVNINNRGVVLYLVEGEQVELPEEEAAFAIALGYIAEPQEPEPEKKTGKVVKTATPEDGLPAVETR